LLAASIWQQVGGMGFGMVWTGGVIYRKLKLKKIT
jgi:hypothetical protein